MANSTVNKDTRRGVYDPVTTDRLPKPHQVRDKRTEHEDAQWGADVRAEAMPGTEPALPEGLRRSPAGRLTSAPDA